MPSNTLVLALLTSLASATSFEYYRSVFCDAQSSNFLLQKYDSETSLSEDTLCHQTPARTLAMKLSGDIDASCVVLAYEDYSCSTLVGSVPASGKCIASTRAKIGSWKASCNTTSTSTSYSSGELKRRTKSRLEIPRDEATTTTTKTLTNQNITMTAGSIASEQASAVSASMINSVEVVTTPSAGAQLNANGCGGREVECQFDGVC